MTARELTPAVQRMALLVDGLRDDQLDLPTPCPDYTVGDLLDHVASLTRALTATARKEPDDAVPPPGDAARLPVDWSTRIPVDLAALADAWSQPGAWDGMTKVAGSDAPVSVAGLVALEELVVPP